MTPGLEKHLAKMHSRAMQIDGLAMALNSCIDAPDLHSACVSMIEALVGITPLLAEGLDTPSQWEA